MFLPTIPVHSSPSHKLSTKLDPIKLNDNNWVLWSKYAHAVRIEMCAEYCIKSDYEGTYKDYRAQTLILQSCTEEYQVQISHLISHLCVLYVEPSNRPVYWHDKWEIDVTE